MSQFCVSGLKPPFPRNRMHVFEADKRSRLAHIQVDFDATEKKEFKVVLQKRGERVKETGEFVKKDVTDQTSLEMNEGDRAFFMLTSEPNGIANVSISYEITQPRKTGSNK